MSCAAVKDMCRSCVGAVKELCRSCVGAVHKLRSRAGYVKELCRSCAGAVRKELLQALCRHKPYSAAYENFIFFALVVRVFFVCFENSVA